MRILLTDIETYPMTAYLWGLFTKYVPINHIIDTGGLMCFSYKWYGDKKTKFVSEWTHTHKGMVKIAYELFEEADAIVSYNGEKFDIPMLHREFVKMGKPPTFKPHSIDLYQVVKKQFRFPSNKLDHVCQELGLGAKVKHDGMELWKNCIDGNRAARKTMKTYNIQDTDLLENLYEYLLPWITQHPNHALYTDMERPVCTNCGSERVHKVGICTTKTMQYQRYRCADCGSPMRGRYSILDKKQKRNILTR